MGRNSNCLLPRLAACGLIALAASTAFSSSMSAWPAVVEPARTTPAGLKAPAFVENGGQWDPQVRFLAQTPGVNLWVTETGITYDFRKVEANKPPVGTDKRKWVPSGKVRGHVVGMEFVGAKRGTGRGVDELSGKLNYFLGKDASLWTTGVRRFGEIQVEQLYKGVSARWYFDQGSPRYDIVVEPGADASQVALRFRGADRVSTSGRSLRLGTSLGDVEHKGLFAYQKIGGATRQVPCSFVVRGTTVRFDVGSYDRSRPLIIDPLIWSSYVGDADEDAAFASEIDSQDEVIVAGWTTSPTLPSSTGAYDSTYNGSGDVLVAKMTSSGNALVYASYLGGSGVDQAYGVRVDASDNPVIAGRTASADFPTSSAFDTTHNGGEDVFVASLGANGATLLYSTYLGGSGHDQGFGVALDASGNPVVCGATGSSGFPTTGGSLSTTLSGPTDGFVAKLVGGSSLTFSTFLGGTSFDSANSVGLDSSDNVYVTGENYAGGFPTSGGAFSTAYNGGVSDAFGVKLNPSGTTLMYGSYLGGTGKDEALGIDVSATGEAVLVGGTTSANFPTTSGAFGAALSGATDVFVTRFNALGTQLAASTLLGGSSGDLAYAVRFDSLGHMVATGLTGSTNFPVTAATAVDTSANGDTDVFVAKVKDDATSLIYGTYLGGSDYDTGYGIGLQSNGDVVVAGDTFSSDYPTTVSAADVTLDGVDDALVSVIGIPTLSGFTGGGTVVGGFAIQATVTLSYAAGSVPIPVSITSNNTNKITGPATVNIPATKTFKTFNIKTYTVLTQTACTVFATAGGVTMSVSVTLNPGGLQAFKINPSTLVGGNGTTGTLILSAPAPSGGRNVHLTSSSPLVTVPSVVNIPQNLTSFPFPITTSPTATQQTVVISAKLGVVTKKVTMTINP